MGAQDARTISLQSRDTTERRKWDRRLLIAGLVAAFILCGVEARGVAQSDLSGALDFKEGKLTAQLNAAPLKLVMQEIGSLSGADIVWLHDGAGTVSVDFSNVPLPRALRLILGEKNFLLFYSSADDDAALSQIWISGGRDIQATALAGRSVNVALLRQWHRTALRGANISLSLQAVEQLKRQAPISTQARHMLAHLARWADHPRVRQAAAATPATAQARK